MTSLLNRISAAPNRAALILISSIVFIRLVVLIFAAPGLGPDEAQYWRWSDNLDWGYFSKPPLIAWMIHLTTSMFGDAEWAVRLYAPIMHGVAAWFLFLLGRRIYDTSIGGWAAAVYLLMPGVWLSSGLVSTDGLLLPIWSAGLYLLWRQRETPNWLQAGLIGLCIGLAFLAKYAALYFFLGIGLVFVFDAPTRKALLQPFTIATILVAAALITPNIMWNAANDFATVSHTAENTKWSDAALSFDHLPKFITDQMAVFGPLSFLILIAGLVFILPSTDKASVTLDRWLLCFIVPVLVIIAIQAVISRAHANWAASAYPAASILVAAWAARANWGALLKTGVAIHAVVGILFLALSLSPALADALGTGHMFKRARAWPETTVLLNTEADEIGATEIVFDERENWHGLDYYGERSDPHLNKRVSLWRRHDNPHSFAEAHAPVTKDPDATLLVASVRADFIGLMRGDFAVFEPVKRVSLPLGNGRERVFCLYRAQGYDPKPRTLELEADIKGKREDCTNW